MITNLDRFLHQTWEEHHDPPSLDFKTEFQGAPEIGIPLLPPIGRPLAATLEANFRDKKGAQATSPFLLSGTKPALEDKTDKNLYKGAKDTYRACGFAVRDLNAAGLMAAYTQQILERNLHLLPEDDAAEARACLQTNIKLNYHAVSWTGRAMDHVLRQESARWISAASLAKDAPEKEELQKLRSSPRELLEGGLEIFQKHASAREETKRLVVSPVPTPSSSYSGHKQANKQRAPKSGYKSRGYGSSAPRSSSSSRPPPPRTSSQGPPPQRSKDERAPPQYRPARGRGRGQRK